MKKKILIIGPAWIGDMVMAQALFRLLKQQASDVMIDVFAPKWTFPLLERMPEISQAIVSPFSHGQLALKQRYQLAKALRSSNYNQAIVLPNSFKSALIPFWAKIPVRTGWLGEMRFGLLNDARFLNKDKLPLMIQRFLALGLNKNGNLPENPNLPELSTDKNIVDTTAAKLKLTTNDQPILVLCPGAEFGSAKRWPARHFASLARQKIADGWQVWLFGSNKDQAVAKEIQERTNNLCVDLTGKTNLAEAIDLLSLASMVVSNDTGLMHIAAALNRPLIVVYGSSSPKFTPPLAKKVKILSLNLDCSPCFKRTCPLKHLKCLQDLEPALVLTVMQELL